MPSTYGSDAQNVWIPKAESCTNLPKNAGQVFLGQVELF